MTEYSTDEDIEKYLDELLKEARETQSYFDDPEDLEGTAEERWARIENDATMARVLGVDPTEFFDYDEEQR